MLGYIFFSLESVYLLQDSSHLCNELDDGHVTFSLLLVPIFNQVKEDKSQFPAKS